MNLETANKVKELIVDECTRFDLSEICDHYGVTAEEFYEFLDTATNSIKDKELGRNQ